MTTPAAPAAAECRYCRGTYSTANPEEVKRHTEPVYCEQSCRCNGRPGCYMCGGSFCVCAAH